MKFRYDINALRALAVTAVVLFITRSISFPADLLESMFFCNLWLSHDFHYHGEIGQGRFSIWDFYYDRAKRIVPGFLGMCFVLLAAGYFLLEPAPIITLVYIDCRAPLLFEFPVLEATVISMRKATPNGSCILGAFRWNGSSIWFIRSFSWDFTGSRDETLYRSDSWVYCNLSVLLCIWFSQDDPIAIFYLYHKECRPSTCFPKGRGNCSRADRRLAIQE